MSKAWPGADFARSAPDGRAGEPGAPRSEAAPSAGTRAGADTSAGAGGPAEAGIDAGPLAGAGPDSGVDGVAEARRPAGEAGPPAVGSPTGAEPAGRRSPPLLVQSIGGWRGLFDSGLPMVVFVAVNAVAKLTPAIWSAIGAAVVIGVVRLLRHESLQQAAGSVFGVAIAALIAERTHQAKGFFLLGIWSSFAYGAVLLVSVLVRWPLVGVIWEYVEGGGSDWRRRSAMMRVYTATTLGWVAVFAARGLVQRFLYDHNRTGWLAVARLAMGYPVTVGMVALTLLWVRRVRRLAAPTEVEVEGGG